MIIHSMGNNITVGEAKSLFHSFLSTDARKKRQFREYVHALSIYNAENRFLIKGFRGVLDDKSMT